MRTEAQHLSPHVGPQKGLEHTLEHRAHHWRHCSEALQPCGLRRSIAFPEGSLWGAFESCAWKVSFQSA